MDKNTLLAVILSVVIITVGFMVQNILWPKEEAASQTAQTEAPSTTAAPPAGQITQALPAADQAIQAPLTGMIVPVSEEIRDETSALETDVLSAVFASRGAVLKSLKLKEHNEEGDFVEMVNGGSSGEAAFEFAFGGPDGIPPVDTVFHVRRRDANTLEFFRDFEIAGYENSSFRLTKSFTVRPGEYLLQVEITLENSQNKYLPLNFNNIAYTLSYGPQIGPAFEKLDGRYDYRNFYAYIDGKRKDIPVDEGKTAELEQRAGWFGVAGKYFAVLAAPVFSDYQVRFSSKPVEGLVRASSFSISRPVIRSARNTDTYRFYIGPKVVDNLNIYNAAGENAFGIKDMNFNEIMDSSFFLGWLEFLLKALLQFFYSLVHNWGVAIIMVTIVVKILTFPLTQKSFKSTSRMQSLGPKLEELKKKYKDNPAKMNQEMATIYKREGINPMSGCLPMLLQIPIFLALYGLFNNHFDLRGAAFFGWINDLSAPDSILNFAPVTVPFLGWSDVRLLPILFVATQLISSKMMQTPASVSNTQMKMMTYGIPVVFFFVLYDVPSGLLVYWIVQNVLSVVQQFVINRKRRLSQE
ncbi:MAG: membrane protein insertase YidC [Spirochaetales bacterium]|jgi:YidC/Oxa1 family membrane protein insertase|nr:membrane protein insertase YidC [Spirochaetales bacterium]